MALKETKEVLGIIAEAQQQCAKVELSIGTTSEDGLVMHGGVYIRDCPASVIEKLTEKGYVMGMDDGRLYILYKQEQK